MSASSHLRFVTVTALALSIVASALGCGADTPPPTAGWGGGVKVPLAPPPSSGIEAGYLGARAREIPLGEKVRLDGPLISLDSYNEAYDSLAWTLSGNRVATSTPIGRGTATWVGALAPGYDTMTVTRDNIRAIVPITVLDTTDAPSPVVVDSFYVTQFTLNGQLSYSPQIVMHDTSGAGKSAVIAVSFELPDPGSSLTCAMIRPVLSASANVFHGWGTAPELTLNVPSVYQFPANGVVVAHVTLRVPGGFAKRLTLQGRVAPGTPPTKMGENATDQLSCW